MSPRAAWRLESLGFREVYEYAPGKVDWLASGLPSEGPAAAIPTAGELAHDDVATCALDDPLDEVASRVEASAHSFCLVVNEERIVLGRVPGEALAGDRGRAAQEVMQAGPVTVRAHLPAAELGLRMRDRGLHTMVVTSPRGRLIGVLRREDAEAAGPPQPAASRAT